MALVNIFLTDPAGDGMEPFAHGGMTFTFNAMDGMGPRRLVEGPMWAFVDWVMPDLSGLEMCRRLRADPRTQDAHITMVLEQDDPDDRRRALRAGADDYIVGPLHRQKVLDRVLALQSRQQQRHATQLVELGALKIDLGAQQARWQEKPIALRPNEFRLLRFLAENPNRVLSRLEMIEGLGKQDPPIDPRTVDVWIGRLRRAFRASGAGNPLRTVHAMGYVLDAP
ncbi:MAG: response regulator transcription factor [Candidatus Andeanibacterium colombiense]|uniref:Response regulator transcription factor n=1 Tax=Candidatus Andeanibacterium colombiense TaxID=3121345 RepID=A0AAJ5X4T7_9SPHN|nr:MAG: response regulator transcription factor [Sphingomonadaceae bacterium]